MKGLRRIFLALAACLLLTAPVWAAETEEGEEEEVYTLEYEPIELIDGTSGSWGNAMLMDGVSWTGTRYRDQLSAWGQEMYDSMEAAFNNGQETYSYETINLKYPDGRTETKTVYCAIYEKEIGRIVPSSNVQAEFDSYKIRYGSEMEQIWQAFTFDHPEFFWIRFAGGGNIIPKQEDTQYIVLASFSFIVYGDSYSNSESRKEIKDRLESTVETILNGCTDMGTVARLAYFDNWLAKHNAYNTTAASTGMDAAGPIPWNATSALLGEYSPVCEGYAKAFQLLCHEIGVPCITVSSSNHMWNMVQVDGQWYHMDCTWNDPVVNGGNSFDYSTRQYFLISAFFDENNTGISGNHTINQTLAWPTAAARDYFATNTPWAISGSTIDGRTTLPAAGQYWMALYNDREKMLGFLPCVSISGTGNSGYVIAPEFSTSIVSQAQSGKVFLISDETSWKPVEAAETFFKTN